MEKTENRKTSIPFREYWDILGHYLRSRKAAFLLLLILIVGGIGLQLINPQIIRSVIDGAIGGRPSNSLIAMAGLFLFVAILQQILGVWAAYIGENLAWRATNELRSDLAAHCLSLDMDYHNNTSPGELIQRIDTDVTEFSTVFSQIVVRILANLLLMAGVIIILMTWNPLLGGIFLIYSVVALACLNQVRNVAVEPERLLREADTAMTGYLEERLAGTEDIRSCGATTYVLDGLSAHQRTILSLWKTTGLAHIWVRLLAGVVLTIGTAIVFIAG